MTSLRERALLSTLQCGSYSGVIRDKDESSEVLSRNNAENGAAKVLKQIMSRRSLKNINAHLAAARATHKAMTLPWATATGILSTKMYMKYTEAMRIHRLGVEAARDALKTDYDYVVAAQKPRLGSLFKAEDYPTADEVAGKFYIDVEIKPIPDAKDLRIDLSDSQAKAIAKDVERRTEERIQGAVQDTFKRVADVTRKMAEKLRDSEGGFRDTLVSNVVELADLLPSLNFSGDERLESLAKRLKSELGEVSPEVLRSDPVIRSKVASKAEAIFNRVSGYMS